MISMMNRRVGALLCAMALLMMAAVPCGALAEDDYVQCDVCGGWFEAGNVFRNHICTPQSDLDYAQCDICGGWYETGNVFRNHICMPVSDPEYVQCDICGDWYEAGNEFRNHICVPKPAADTVSIGTLYVNTPNGKSLQMRAEPNADSAVVTNLANGTALTLFSYVGNNWAYVASRSYFGYCAVRYLSDTRGGQSVTPTTPDKDDLFANFEPANYTVEVNPTSPTGFVNLRWAPTMDMAVQTIYYAGETLRVIATDGIWSQVYNDATNACGFILNDYLKIVR